MKKLLLLMLVLTSVLFQACFGQKKLIIAIDAKNVEKLLKSGADTNGRKVEL